MVATIMLVEVEIVKTDHIIMRNFSVAKYDANINIAVHIDCDQTPIKKITM